MTTNEELKGLIEEMINQHKTIIELLVEGYELPDPDPEPEPDRPFVTMKETAPLMEISHYDGKNKPPEKRKEVLRLYKYGLLKKGRIKPKVGKKLYYTRSVKTAQGIAFVLSSNQEVDGKHLSIGTRTRASIPGTRNPKITDKSFRILKRLVKV